MYHTRHRQKKTRELAKSGASRETWKKQMEGNPPALSHTTQKCDYNNIYTSYHAAINEPVDTNLIQTPVRAPPLHPGWHLRRESW